MKKYPLAIVTGAAHRLGRVFALSLAHQGFAILLHYNSSSIDADKTSGELESLGVPVHLFRADLTSEGSIDNLLAVVDSLPFQPRVLVNSASIMLQNNIQSTTTEDWDLTFALNLRTPFFLAQKLADRMKTGGLIVNITDNGASKLWTRYPSYVISKFALEKLTKLLAKTYAPCIRVNAIAPGLVLPAKGMKAEEWQRLVDRIPMKQATNLADIASALEFLLSNESITGQIITVDGGYSLL